MPREKPDMFEQNQTPDKQKVITAAATLDPWNQRVEIAATGGVNFDVTVWHPAQTPDHIISIIMTARAAAEVATLVVPTLAGGNLTLNAVGEGVVLWSDGVRWWALSSTIA